MNRKIIRKSIVPWIQTGSVTRDSPILDYISGESQYITSTHSFPLTLLVKRRILPPVQNSLFTQPTCWIHRMLFTSCAKLIHSYSNSLWKIGYYDIMCKARFTLTLLVNHRIFLPEQNSFIHTHPPSESQDIYYLLSKTHCSHLPY